MNQARRLAYVPPPEPEEGSPEDALAPADANVPDPEPSDPDVTESGDPTEPREAEPGIRQVRRVKVTLTKDESAYRNRRLEASVLQRVRRRYASDLSGYGVAIEDFLAGVTLRALEAEDFPGEEQPMFPWIYRHGNSELQRLQRHVRRDRDRYIYADDVPDRAAPEPRELSDRGHRLMDIVRRRTANDPVARETVDRIAAQAVLADANDPQPETAAQRKRKSRLLGELRALATRAGVPVAAFALLLGVLTHYDQLRHRMDESHDAIPVAERDPMPAPREPDDSSLRAEAQGLREAGLAACQAKRWDECIAKLTAAGREDPKLAKDPVVVEKLDFASFARNAKGPAVP